MMHPAAYLTSLEKALGRWTPGERPPVPVDGALGEALGDIHDPFLLVTLEDGALAVGRGGEARIGSPEGAHPIVAHAPAVDPRHLGDPSFCADHRLRYPYMAGSMANGISSVAMVKAMSREGMLGFFGAAGLTPAEVKAAILELKADLGDAPFGCNLIHSPSEPNLEAAVADLFLEQGVRLVEASAYIGLTLPLVKYRVTGIHRDADGRVVAPNRVIAKVSRVEVASKFFAPPPGEFLEELVAAGHLSGDQARMAASIPMAQDVTVEADSAGHTDNRPSLALFPALVALRDRFQEEHEYAAPLRLGLAGGIATPDAAAAAFSLGAAYVVTGSVNQACVESGSCEAVRTMLAEAGQADVVMAPAADMFEMGVKLQVLKRGTMFPMRAAKLYELYRAHGSLEEIPAADRAALEKSTFRAPLGTIWEQTGQYFRERDPAELERAAQDPKHKMALVFRWYLGMSSVWANRGEASRKMDYQVWCGPAMGAFNEWTRGTELAAPGNRSCVTAALNILYGAAVLTRIFMLRAQGVEVTPGLRRLRPQSLARIKERLHR
jgi:PfaD family protein